MSRPEDEARGLYEDAAKALRDGKPAEALIALDLAWSLLDGPALRGRPEHDATRVALQGNRGTVLRELGDPAGSLAAYDAGLALLEGPALRGRPEHDATRAKLQMNRDNALFALGDPAGALAACDAAGKILEGSALRGRPEHDSTRARLQINRGNALRALGDPAGALAAYDAAGKILEGPVLGGRPKHDATRARLQGSRGNALRALGDPAGALAAYDAAAVLLEGPALRGRPKHDATRAQLQGNRGNALRVLGDPAGALAAYDAAAVLLEGPALRGRPKHDATRARLQRDRGGALFALGDPAGAVAAYDAAEKILEGPALRGRPEHDADRARLQMNRGNALLGLGAPAEALAAYDAAAVLLEGPALRGRPEHDADRARLQGSRGNALSDLGDPAGSLAAYDAAAALLEGAALRGRPEHDATRATLQMNRGTALGALGDPAGALAAYDAVEMILEGPVLRGRPEYDDLRARLQGNRGNALRVFGDPAGALVAYEAAQRLFEGGTIGDLLPRNAERCLFYANMSELLLHMPDPHAWARDASARMATMLELAPREVGVSAWGSMRSRFAKMHANWLRFALERGDLDVVPEVLAAVGGREAAADVLDRLGEDGRDAGSDEALAELSRVRLELRAMAEAARGGSNPMGDGGFGGMRGGLRGPESFGSFEDPGGSALPEARARLEEARAAAEAERAREEMERYRTLHARFVELRREAQDRPGYELLGAPHRALTAEALRDRLGADEALLMVFAGPKVDETEASAGLEPDKSDGPEVKAGSDASAHVLLLRPGAAAVHLGAPVLRAAAARTAAYAAAQDSRSGMRRGGHGAGEVDTAASAAAAVTGAAPMPNVPDLPADAPAPAFWSDLADLQRDGLWDRLAPHLEGVSRVVAITHGPLHQLALTAGAPEGLEVARFPGLVYFALKRGLYDGGADDGETDGETGSERGEGAIPPRPSGPAKPAPIFRPARLGILAHAGAAGDIPLAPMEGRAAAALWQGAGGGSGAKPEDARLVVEVPAAWPRGERLDLLHVACHGDLLPRGAPDARSVILLGEQDDIDEAMVAGAPPVDVVFLNICLGGRSVDDPFDGSPSGLVTGFLRRGARAVVAALPPLPDRWALVLGLLFTHELAMSGAEGASSDGRPVAAALRRAKDRLARGDWPAPVAAAIRDRVIPDMRTTMLPSIRKDVRTVVRSSYNTPEKAAAKLVAAEIRPGQSLWWARPGLRADADLRAALDRLPRGTVASGCPHTAARFDAMAEAVLRQVCPPRTPMPPDPETLGLITHGIVLFGEG